jgi:HTH-type transcriptional regulator/antitoxin HigA
MTTIPMPIIKTDADLAEALGRLDAIIDAPDGSRDADERTALSDLIAAYEDRHHPMPKTNGIGTLRHCMAIHGLTQYQVPEIGPQSLVSAVLSGKRPLNLRMARALGARFHLNPAAFIALEAPANPRRVRSKKSTTLPRK